MKIKCVVDVEVNPAKDPRGRAPLPGDPPTRHRHRAATEPGRRWTLTPAPGSDGARPAMDPDGGTGELRSRPLVDSEAGTG